MSSRTIADLIHRDVPTLATDTTIGKAIALLRQTALPALPVVDDRGGYAGIFGEREFIAALFPGYLRDIGHAAFVPSSIETALDKRAACLHEPVIQWMNAEHLEAGPDVSDVQLAETFLNHRVLVVPICDHHHVTGLITRRDFFDALADRLPTPPLETDS
jgi:CBS-domain-containing membrane protein